MSGKHYPNSGTLSKNDRKEKPEHPDYTGKAEVDGQRYWMNAWLKKSADGRSFMSFSFKPMQERPAEPIPQPVKGNKPLSIDDDSIPF